MNGNKKKIWGICIFCTLLFLLLYASVKKTDKNTSNNLNNEYNFSLEQKNEKVEESIKWEKTLYQKYEKWLLDNDKCRNSFSIFTEEEQWKNNPEVYCELWGESFFGNLGAEGLVGITTDMFSDGEPITGGLIAEKPDGDSLGMRIVTDDEMGYVEYFYYDLGELCYLSCRGLEERGEDLPEYAVCTQDGQDDYVAVVYQEKFDAYRKEELIRDHDEIWLFLSNAEGEYDKKNLLSDMPFYCPELKFSGKGMLVCENLIGFESYINDPCRTEYFLYDQEKEDFYLFRAQQAKDGNIIIDDKETVGEFNIKDYYLEKYHETEGWELSKDSSAKIKYADSRVFCEEIDGPCGGISVIIDAKSGLPIDITKMITKKEMLEICRKGMKSMDRNKMSPEEIEIYTQYVQAGYETASSLTPCSELEQSEEKIQIKFLITAWGIECACVKKKENGAEEYSGFMIDKEYFMDTPLWKYMDPIVI